MLILFTSNGTDILQDIALIIISLDISILVCWLFPETKLSLLTVGAGYSEHEKSHVRRTAYDKSPLGPNSAFKFLGGAYSSVAVL